MTYLAQVVRPTICCKSTQGMGEVHKIYSLEPADHDQWSCGLCGAMVPSGEVMAKIGFCAGIPKVRLANLPAPEEVAQYDVAPVEGVKA